LNKREQVNAYLQEIKDTIQNPVAEQGWVLVPRPENTGCILQLGFKYPDIRDTLLSLSADDYCEGPSRDRDIPGELWVFGKVVGTRTIYIKIKLASLGSLKIVRIISFHFAEYSLIYPLK
jgi:hypothetical protein